MRFVDVQGERLAKHTIGIQRLNGSLWGSADEDGEVEFTLMPGTDTILGAAPPGQGPDAATFGPATITWTAQGPIEEEVQLAPK